MDLAMQPLCQLLPDFPQGITSWQRCDVRSLQNETKKGLLNAKELQADAPAANVLASRLEELCPTVKSRYVVKDGEMDHVAFKLYNPGREQTANDPGKDESSYIAMSYRWKQPSSAGAAVVSTPALLPVAEGGLPVSRLLFNCVLEHLESPAEGLWCDQICINQDDEEEKSTVIAYMDRIYEQARIVLIVLDDIELSEGDVQALIAYYELFRDGTFAVQGITPMQDAKPPYMETHTALRKAVETILYSSWFWRAWCAHEMKLGKTHLFLVKTRPTQDDDGGGGDVGGARVIRFTGTFLMCLLQLHVKVLVHQTDVLLDQELRQLIELAQTSESVRVFLTRNYFKTLSSIYPTLGLTVSVQSNDYNGVIFDVFNSQADGSDRIPNKELRRIDALKDKVSIVLNTLHNGLALKRDEKSMKTISGAVSDFFIRDLMLIALAARDPVSLCSVGRHLRLENGPNASWISMPDIFDRGRGNDKLPLFEPFPNISVDQEPGCEFIELDMCILPTYHSHRATSDPTMINRLNTARDFLKLSIEKVPTLNHLQHSRKGLHQAEIDQLDDMNTQTLACILECGATWQSRDSTSSPEKFSRAFCRFFSAAGEGAYSRVNWSDEEIRADAEVIWDNIIWVRNHAIPWVAAPDDNVAIDNMIKLWAWQPIVVQLELELEPESTRSLKAICCVQSSVEIVLAVPVVLLRKEYADLPRVWVLERHCEQNRGEPEGKRAAENESTDDVKNYDLLGKTRLLGEVGFGEVFEAANQSRERFRSRVYAGVDRDREKSL